MVLLKSSDSKGSQIFAPQLDSAWIQMDEKHHVDAAHDSPRSFPVQDLEQLSGFLKWEIIYEYSKKEITYKKKPHNKNL